MLGSAITASDSNLTFTGNTTFLGNSETFEQLSGGEISTSHNPVLKFSATSSTILVTIAGGAICTSANTVLNFSGINNFINNSAGKLGGAIYIFPNTVLSLTGTTHFINSSAPMGGTIYASAKNTLKINETI